MHKPSVASFAEKIITGSKSGIISVPSVVTGIRQQLPECEHTDEELAHVVSMIALSKGRNLSFVRPKGYEIEGS